MLSKISVCIQFEPNKTKVNLTGQQSTQKLILYRKEHTQTESLNYTDMFLAKIMK